MQLWVGNILHVCVCSSPLLTFTSLLTKKQHTEATAPHVVAFKLFLRSISWLPLTKWRPKNLTFYKSGQICRVNLNWSGAHFLHEWLFFCVMSPSLKFYPACSGAFRDERILNGLFISCLQLCVCDGMQHFTLKRKIVEKNPKTWLESCLQSTCVCIRRTTSHHHAT